MAWVLQRLPVELGLLHLTSDKVLFDTKPGESLHDNAILPICSATIIFFD